MEEIKLKLADGSEMLRHLLQRYLIQIRRIYQANEAHRSAKDRNSHHIFNQFKQAVDQHFVDLAAERRDDPPTVQGMAQALHLNASYLNTSIKNLTGSTACAG